MFDPPELGTSRCRGAIEALGLERLIVVVVGEGAQAGRDRRRDAGPPRRGRVRGDLGVELSRPSSTAKGPSYTVEHGAGPTERYGDVLVVGWDEFADFRPAGAHAILDAAAAVATRRNRRASASTPPRNACARPTGSSSFKLDPLLIAPRRARRVPPAASAIGRAGPVAGAQLIDELGPDPATLKDVPFEASGLLTRRPRQRIAGDRPGKAGDRYDDPRHAARVLVHGLLRHLHGRERAPDEVDLRRGALPLKAEENLIPRNVAVSRRLVDPRRLPRRRPARVHAGGARLLPARGSSGATCLGRDRGAR